MRFIAAFLFSLLVATSASGQTGTIKTKAALSTEISTCFTDPLNFQITPAIVRGCLQDFLASWQQTPQVNPQTGTTYLVSINDYGKLVTLNNSSPVAVTLPGAAGSFTAFNFYASNLGSGTVTITPQNGSTINGASSLTLATGQSQFIVSDGTNYQVASGGAGITTYTAPGSGATTRTISSKLTDVVSILDYGADPTGISDSTTAIQNAINSVTAGGRVIVPGSGYNVSNPITITKPVTIQCSNFLTTTGGNINMTSQTNNMFVVNSSHVTFEDCYLNATGTPSTNQAIVVGTDSTSITDGTCTNGSTTFTSTAQANFTSLDVGKYINATNCGTGPGPLFTTIASVSSSTTVILTAAASCGGSCPAAGAAIAKYANNYVKTTLINDQIVNFNQGLHIQNGAEWRAFSVYGNNNISIHIENQTSPDHGNGYIIGSYLLAIDSGAGHYPVLWNSGGEVYIVGTKLLKGQYGLYHNSNVGLTGVLSFTGGGVENCSTNAFFFSEAAQFNDVLISNSEISCGAPNIVFDNASAAIVNTVIITGNDFQGGGGNSIDLGKVNYANVTGNTISTGGGNPSIFIRSNCTTCYAADNLIIGATTRYTNNGISGSYVNGETFPWTPVLAGTSTAGAPTYGTNGQVGSYEVNGRLVTARFTIITTALGGPTGNMQITGLPIASTATTNDVGGCTIVFMSGVTLDASYTTLTGQINSGGLTAIALYELGSGQGGQQTPVGKFAAATVLEGVCQYHF